MKKPPASLVRKHRCAIYTRKSSEEGLELEFNSLHAQRDACSSYIVSQRHEGWLELTELYDDGGFSGAGLERPALKRLIADIEEGLIDIVVIYKIDRLSRSLKDFLALVELFERLGVTLVSVTQSFNTTTSMGRLTLNMLLSFAQYERETTADRIKDKVAASRKRGLWMGGKVPLGYLVQDRKLVVKSDEAVTVRSIFERFVTLQSATAVARELTTKGVTTRSGTPIDKLFLYRLLNNKVYVGEAVHKGTAYPGEHEAIISRDLWDSVHEILRESPRSRGGRNRANTPALLKGLLFGPTGCAMSPTHTRRGNKLYRYYVDQRVLKHGAQDCPLARVPAGEVEAAVIDQLRRNPRRPEVIVGTWLSARSEIEGLAENEVRSALQDFHPLWEELFPAEQARIVHLLVERVVVGSEGLSIRLRTHGLAQIVEDLRGAQASIEQAA